MPPSPCNRNIISISIFVAFLERLCDFSVALDGVDVDIALLVLGVPAG